MAAPSSTISPDVPAAAAASVSSPTAAIIEAHELTKKETNDCCREAAVPISSDTPLHWYFAIGSMMNPTSMNLRNLYPKQSLPGILHGWRLAFHGAGGMGDIVEDATSSFHGILHQVTNDEMKHLDSIESIYNRIPVQVKTYSGEMITAGAYQMDRTKVDMNQVHALPGERYLDIIMRGAVHYGVSEDYIEILKKIPVQPRKLVSEYRLIPNPPEVTITQTELAAATGDNGGPLMISVNGKVLRFKADPASSPEIQRSYDWMKMRYGGQETCLKVSQTLYEPKYPIPTTFEAMTPEQKLWSEELFFGFTRSANPPPVKGEIGVWEIVGWLEGQRNGR